MLIPQLGCLLISNKPADELLSGAFIPAMCSAAHLMSAGIDACLHIFAPSSLADVLSGSLFTLDLRGLYHRLARFSGLMAAPFSLKGHATTDYSPCFCPTARKIIIGATAPSPLRPKLAKIARGDLIV